jgi:hypothetical protein
MKPLSSRSALLLLLFSAAVTARLESNMDIGGDAGDRQFCQRGGMFRGRGLI